MENPCKAIEIPHYTTIRSYVDGTHGTVWRVRCSCGWRSARHPRQEDAISWEFFHHRGKAGVPDGREAR